MRMCLTGNGNTTLTRDAHPTGNGDVTHQKCLSAPGMRMCLTGKGDVTFTGDAHPHREWVCDSLELRLLI